TTIPLKFMLINDGMGSAEDTDVNIHFLGKCLVTNKCVEPPKEPTLSKKRGLAELGSVRRDIMESITPLPQLLAPPNVSKPKVTQTSDGCMAHFHVQRIKQGKRIAFGNVYVVLPSIAEAKSFGVKYVLNSH